MDSIDRLQLLSEQMQLEPAEERRENASRPACFTPKQRDAVFVHPAQLPNGQSIKLLKTLLTSTCEHDCFYCPFRAGRDFRRATFKPQEFANVFMELKSQRNCRGNISEFRHRRRRNANARSTLGYCRHSAK